MGVLNDAQRVIQLWTSQENLETKVLAEKLEFPSSNDVCFKALLMACQSHLNHSRELFKSFDPDFSFLTTAEVSGMLETLINHFATQIVQIQECLTKQEQFTSIEPQVKMFNLGQDTIDKVLSFLEPGMLMNTRKTCKILRIASERLLEKRITLGNLGSSESLSICNSRKFVLSKSLQQFPFIRYANTHSVELWICCSNHSRCSLFEAMKIPKVSHLGLNLSPKHSNCRDGMKSLFLWLDEFFRKHSEHLQDMELRIHGGLLSKFQSMHFPIFTNVKRLSVSIFPARDVDDSYSGFAQFYSSFSSLENFSLCSPGAILPLSDVLTLKLELLKVVSFRGVQFAALEWESIETRLIACEELCFQTCKIVGSYSSETWFQQKVFRRLKNLDMSLDPSWFYYLPGNHCLHPSSYFPQLSQMRITGREAITVELLKAICQKAPQLTEFRSSIRALGSEGNEHFSQSAVSQVVDIFEGMKKLEVVNLYFEPEGNGTPSLPFGSSYQKMEENVRKLLLHFPALQEFWIYRHAESRTWCPMIYLLRELKQCSGNGRISEFFDKLKQSNADLIMEDSSPRRKRHRTLQDNE
jgi:hypothetical protein